jgi:hypothetical protein
MGTHRTNTAAAAALIAVLTLGASACGNDDDSASSTVEAPSEFARAGGETDAGPTAADSNGSTGRSTVGPARAPSSAARALAVEAGVTVTSSNIREATDDTLTSVARNGGTVHTADVNIGSERDDGSVDGSGYFVVKVAPADLEPLIDDLGATVGTVTGRTQDTSDVTDQLVDLDIRIRVERTVIARYEDLLPTATELSDIVAIENVISEHTIALEQLLATKRNLDDRVERSTLTIDLRYVDPSSDPALDRSDDGIADAWRAGWDGFVGVLFTVGFVLAVAAPFLLSALFVAGVIGLVTRRMRRRTISAPSGPSTGVREPDEPLASPSPQR